jgi:uncharacterized repeat protein (TIGR01451 family)
MVQNTKIQAMPLLKIQRLDSPLFRALARDLLRAGQNVCFQAQGMSMFPEIKNGELVHVAPVSAGELRCGEIVLIEDGTKLRAHRLIAKDVRRDQFMTQGDANPERDAPVGAAQILGRVIAKEVIAKEQTMNGIEQRVQFQRVELHGMRAQARRRMTQMRNLAAGWVKAALGMRPAGARTGVALSLLLLCLAAVPVSAQVAVDAGDAGGGGRITTGGNFTFTHTTAGASRILVVGVAMNITNNTAAQVSGITYNSLPLTFLSAHNDAGNTRRVEIWFRLAPTLGTNTIQVTLNAFGAGTIGATAGGVTFTGADQTDPVRPFVSTDGAAAATPWHSVLDVPSALQEFVYAVEAIGGNFDQALPAPGFGGISQQWTGSSNVAQTDPPDVTGAGYTVTGAPSVPIPVVFTHVSGGATTNWAVGAVSIHPLNADMGVTVTTTGAILAGAQTTYTVKLQNNGWSDAANVNLSFPLAAGETLVSAVPSQGSACTGTTTVSCNLGTVPSAFSATVTIKATIATAGNYTTTATVSSSTTDLYTSNNTFTTTVPVQSVVCATPGKDGAGGTLAGIVNTYYPGTANAAAGATSISVGASTGSATAIASGDLLIVMQMQDAAINTTNGSTYGDGSGAGSGSTNLNAAGAYEYVKATGAVSAGAVAITGAGAGGGLIYSYTNANATTTQGQRRFQVIRVPQYLTATLGATLTASAWNGTTGGVLAFDVENTLILNSVTVSVDGLGFRGGAGLQLVGGTFTPAAANTDFVFVSPTSPYTAGTSTGWHGGKGEGIAGTPMWVDSAGAPLLSGSTYPSGGAADGSMGRGAPGNAGGGGTDAVQTTTNSNNSGGSGGANGGGGGAGGNSQAVDLASGGIPSAAFPNSINRVVMGGGGASGGRNNSTGDASAGGAGGGIVIIRAGFLTGTGTITANGASVVVTTANDGGGGGGAGGSIIVLSQAGGENGLTLNAKGGAGGSTNTGVAFAVFTGGVHGPGGGGGGGFIASSNVTGSPVTNRTGGAFGTTESAAFEWGATAGANGPTPTNNAKLSQVAGVRSGVECAAADCVIAKSHVGNFVHGTTNNNYTVTVSNASPSVSTSGLVTVVDTLPTGMTATSIPTGTGWTCVLLTLTCTRSDALAPLASYPPITVPVTVAANPPSNTLTNTVTVSGGGELQTNNDTATDVTTIIGTVLTISKSGAPNPIRPGQTLTYTINVANNGPNAEATATVTDPLPTTDVTFVSASATNGWACAQAAGTVTCSKSPFAIGGTSVITIVTTTTIPDTVVNTATITDTDTGLDTQSATATTTTTFPTSIAVRSFSAQRIGGGTVINWQTGGERHNLGFNVYREENGARVKVNPALIAGSALRMRQSLDQHNANSYAWPDAKTGSAYWLEDVEINGARTMHGPVYPEASASGASTPANIARAATMSELSRASAQSSAATSNVAAAGPVFDTSRAVPHFATLQTVTPQQRQTQFELAAHPAVKLSLRNEGWYRVSQKELVAAGLNAAADPKSLQLFMEGIEQPIRIAGASSGPGGFGPEAAIEFYATGIDTPFSDTRIGWLVAGNRTGLRIAEAGNAGGNAGPLSFPYAVELRQRLIYFAALLNGENNDNFFGALVNATPVDQVLNVRDIDATGPVQLEVALQGVTTGINHGVNVNLNGTFVGAVNFADQSQGKILLDVPAGQLLEGANTVTLTAENGDSDVSLVDHITLHYPHTYVAESDALRFTAPAGGHVQITGFGTKPVRLVDISNPARPVNLQPKVTGPLGQYVLDVNVPWTASGTHTLLALAGSQLAHAPSAKNQPSSWHSPQAGSDIVMITHPNFVQALQPLVKLRQSQGKSVSVVSVDNLYDEFNFGERSPQALRDFLVSATGNWKTSPQYLLLVGDATFDPRNYLGFGYDDFVPTRIVETFYLKTASDEWFSDFKGTGVGQIATGRLPVRTDSDAQTVVRKITGYEKSSGTWSKQTLLVADTDGGLGFSTDTKEVKSLLPSSLTGNIVDANQLGDAAAHAQILAGVNSGQLLVNYLGHGSVQVWGNGNLLTDTDATTLTNRNRLPVFLIMDCLNGFFQDVYTTSLAESLLLAPNGGAVAVWSSSGLNDSVPQAQLDKDVVRGLFAAQNPALGDVIRAAKLKTDVLDVRHTYILFGDPAMRLQH